MIDRKFLVILLFVCSFFIVNLQAQIKIEYPYVTYTSIPYCLVHKIEMDGHFTKVFLYYKNPYPNGWVNFSRATTLIELGKNRAHKLIYTEGIPLSPQKKSSLIIGESVYCSLFFPPISENTKYIEINENTANGFHFVVKLEYNIKRYLEQCERMEAIIKEKKEGYARWRTEEMMRTQEQKSKRNQNRVKSPTKRRKTLVKDPDFKID